MKPVHRASSPLRWILVLIGGVLFAAGVVLFWTQPGPETVAAAGEQATLRHIATLRVRPRELRWQAEVAGVIEPRRAVQIFAESQGRVLEIGAEVLDRVAAEQLLVQLDPLLAEVAVEQAEAEVAKRASELELARSNWKRQRSLAERGVVSQAVLDDARNAANVARAALRESRAELKRSRDDLTKKTIRAPFAGVLRRFSVEAGEYVRSGEALGELLDLERARVTIGLADHQVVHVEPGQPVRVSVEAYPNERFPGTILRVGRAADDVNKKFPVEIELANAEGRLLPGMVARVVFELGGPMTRLVVPHEAALDEFGLRFLYVVESVEGSEVGTVRRRRVQLRALPFRPGELEVVEGLSGGEEIAITGIRQLKDGERVLREPRDAT